jgi:hypothetical protein
MVIAVSWKKHKNDTMETHMKTNRTILSASLAAASFRPRAADEIQSVVVTAQSRKQLVQDVPMTMPW